MGLKRVHRYGVQCDNCDTCTRVDHNTRTEALKRAINDSGFSLHKDGRVYCASCTRKHHVLQAGPLFAELEALDKNHQESPLHELIPLYDIRGQRAVHEAPSRGPHSLPPTLTA